MKYTFWKFAEPKDALCRFFLQILTTVLCKVLGVPNISKTGLFVQLKVTVGLIYFRHVKVRC